MLVPACCCPGSAYGWGDIDLGIEEVLQIFGIEVWVISVFQFAFSLTCRFGSRTLREYDIRTFSPFSVTWIKYVFLCIQTSDSIFLLPLLQLSPELEYSRKQ